jgi:(p)ppGpp synthase/HD superfamily hydrolase
VLLGSALTRLRAASLRSVAEQQALAIEAIQLYAPLAHAVGFGAAFSELVCLACRQELHFLKLQ